jgi:hypothetical protein
MNGEEGLGVGRGSATDGGAVGQEEAASAGGFRAARGKTAGKPMLG